MKTVEITVGPDDGYPNGFDGYPNGTVARRFMPGEEVELSDAYAEVLIGKALAREKGVGAKGGAKKPPPKPAEDEPPAADPAVSNPNPDVTEPKYDDK